MKLIETMPSMIVAATVDGIIGYHNTIPWKCSRDLRQFKRITTGHPIIMGRNTYESLPHPLPNRLNIVVTSREIDTPNDVIVARSVGEATIQAQSWCDEHDNDQFFFIGGQTIYESTIDDCSLLYLTIIHQDNINGDRFFPITKLTDKWMLIGKNKHPECTFLMYYNQEKVKDHPLN